MNTMVICSMSYESFYIYDSVIISSIYIHKWIQKKQYTKDYIYQYNSLTYKYQSNNMIILWSK